MKTLDEIAGVFDLLDDWDQRYNYIIEIGEGLPAMPLCLKTEANKVKGCMSQVWVCAYHAGENQGAVHYHADCDTAIIKGVLAILVQILEGKTPQQIQQFDIDEIFSRLHLDDHLSPNRHFGIYAIVDLMKKQAISLARPAEKHAASL